MDEKSNYSEDVPVLSSAMVSEDLWLADDSGHVYMTIDTSQSMVFPEVGQFVVEEGTTGSSELSFAETKSGEGGSDGTKLDTLASAASVQTPLLNQHILVNGIIFPPANAEPLPLASYGGGDLRDLFVIGGGANSNANQLLFCGECSATFDHGDGFFQHWLERHCRLEETAAAAVSGGERLNLEQCARCRHVFVKGTRKFEEHELNCCDEAGGGTKRKMGAEEKAARSLKAAKKAAGGGSSSSSSSSCHLSCGVCSADLKTITSFFLHWLDNHHLITDILLEVWKCGQCAPAKLFHSSERLTSHVKDSHPFFWTATNAQCDACHASYMTNDELVDHLGLQHGGPGLCRKCDEGASAEDLARHFQEQHETLCELCDCQVDTDVFTDHLASVHRAEQVWNRRDKLMNQISPDVVVEQKSAVVAGTKTVAKSVPTAASSVSAEVKGGGSHCRACGIFFKSEKLLEKHYFANHEFQCKFCSLKMDKDLYGDHLRLHLASQRKKGGGP